MPALVRALQLGLEWEPLSQPVLILPVPVVPLLPVEVEEAEHQSSALVVVAVAGWEFLP